MDKKGMTYIELIAVIAIITIIFLTVIPKTTIALNFKERKDLMELKRDILYARNMSIIDVKRYSLDMYPKKGYYYINKHNSAKKIIKIKKKVLTNNLKIVTVNFNGSNNRDYGRLLFNKTGAPRMAGNIKLTNSKNQDLELTVEVATGKVNIYYDRRK